MSLNNSKFKLWGLIIFLLFLIVGVFIFVNKNKLRSSINYKFGSADYCKTNPFFVKQMKIPEPVYIDMTQTKGKGMVMISGGKNGKPFQFPTWSLAGYLGPYAMDEIGNIYVVPIPFVSIEEYPPQEQCVIYKVDSKTGKMDVFMELPWASPPHEKNPFNILGLAYDCDTRSLYASIVTGSTYEEEKGRIYQIDLKNKKIVDQINNIDVLGLGIFNFKKRKRMYLGMARSPELHSIYLDQDGHFIKKPKLEFALNELPGGGFDKCHRIRFLRNNTMELKGIDFNYTLHAESDVQRNIYNFRYDNNVGDWKFIEVHKQ